MLLLFNIYSNMLFKYLLFWSNMYWSPVYLPLYVSVCLSLYLTVFKALTALPQYIIYDSQKDTHILTSACFMLCVCLRVCVYSGNLCHVCSVSCCRVGGGHDEGTLGSLPVNWNWAVWTPQSNTSCSCSDSCSTTRTLTGCEFYVSLCLAATVWGGSGGGHRVGSGGLGQVTLTV